MADHPILFSAPMVRALLAGQKTQTRRTLRPGTTLLDGRGWRRGEAGMATMLSAPDETRARITPRYAVGDRLWVRETWFDARPYADAPAFADLAGGFAYRADDTFIGCHKWRPSIHMPRAASRLTLAVTDVRIQHLTEISEADAMAEGVVFCEELPHTVHRYAVELGGGEYSTDWTAREAFAGLWEHINGLGEWDKNPLVIALTFTVHRQNIDTLPEAPQ